MFYYLYVVFVFFKQKTAYEVRISDWRSDVCSSDLLGYADGFPEGRSASMQAGSTLTVGPLIFARASSAWSRLHNSTSAGTLALAWCSSFAGGGGHSNKAPASITAVYGERVESPGGEALTVSREVKELMRGNEFEGFRYPKNEER